MKKSTQTNRELFANEQCWETTMCHKAFRSFFTFLVQLLVGLEPELAANISIEIKRIREGSHVQIKQQTIYFLYKFNKYKIGESKKKELHCT